MSRPAWVIEPVDNGYVVRVFNNGRGDGYLADATFVATSLGGLFKAMKLADVASKLGTNTATS